MQPSLLVHAPVQHVHAEHAGVHGVRVLLHGGFGHGVPRMAARDTNTIVSTAGAHSEHSGSLIRAEAQYMTARLLHNA